MKTINQKRKIKNKKVIYDIKIIWYFCHYCHIIQFFSLSLTGIGFIVIPISNGIACRLTISNKVINEIVMQKYNKYKTQYEKYLQAIKSFNELYRRSVQDNLIDISE